MAYLTWREIPLRRSVTPSARRPQQPRPGTYGNATVARMMAGGAWHHSSSSSSRRTATITTLPPRSRATAATRATNVRALAPLSVGAPQGPAASTSSGPSTSAPHRPRHLTKPTACRQRHADYGPSGTIEGRRATEPPTRVCVQTGGTTTPTTTPRGHRNPGAPGVTCPMNTGAVGTQPEQPPGTAHLHMDWAPSPTGSPAPQPQTPPCASTHRCQPAASWATATQARPEPRPRHGTPDRPTEGPASAPPKGPPKQARAASPTDTTSTRPSGTVHRHAHNHTESPNPRAPATPSTAAPGDLQATAKAEPASQRHHAPPSGPAVRPTEPSSPGRLAPDQDQGPDPAHTTVQAEAPRSAGPVNRPGTPPVLEGHAREEARRTGDAATPPPPTTSPQRQEPTVDATEKMREPPQRTETPPPAEKPSGGVDQRAIQHADPPGIAAKRGSEASTAGQPGTEPEEPIPDTGKEAGLHPPSAHGAQPAGCAGAAPLANPAHHADASAPGEAPPRGPPETREEAEARETTPDTPQRTAGRETSPSGHNRDEDSFDAFMESCISDPHAVPTPAAPRVRLERRRDDAEGRPLTMSRQAHLQRDYTALGHTEHATASGDGHATAGGAADQTPDRRGAQGSGARVEAGTNTASEPTGPPAGTAPPWRRGISTTHA